VTRHGGASFHLEESPTEQKKYAVVTSDDAHYKLLARLRPCGRARQRAASLPGDRGAPLDLLPLATSGAALRPRDIAGPASATNPRCPTRPRSSSSKRALDFALGHRGSVRAALPPACAGPSGAGSVSRSTGSGGSNSAMGSTPGQAPRRGHRLQRAARAGAFHDPPERHIETSPPGEVVLIDALRGAPPPH
jgi:hypothetical protein